MIRFIRWLRGILGVQCMICGETRWVPGTGWELYSSQTPLNEMVCSDCKQKR